jgi:hypothetical protein
VAGATAELQDAKSKEVKKKMTVGPDGRFTFEKVEAGSYTLAGSNAQQTYRGTLEVEIAAGKDQSNLKVVLKP